MNLSEFREPGSPFGIVLTDHNKKPVRLSKTQKQSAKIYPVLIVETLPKSFGKIDKNNQKKRPDMAREEEYLLNLIARIAVEIFIKEEL